MKDLITLSEQILLSVKNEQPSDSLTSELEQYLHSQLHIQLKTDGQKKAFWINIYNAYFLILRKYQNVDKPDIYRKKLVTIAGKKWSLDDIEHGILRKGRFKYSFGFFPNPFLSKAIKQLAVKKIDYRIHFALNCGAKSCPPIAFYSADKIDQQLKTATLSFLENETTIDQDNKTISVSRLMLWYLGDFGGKSGIKRILKNKLNLNTRGYKVIFNQYSWEENLDNFI
ncbi:MAG: DUF547 domain-containing protein [Bacteroidetes bacterium]|nr:MAG: DUF547 domain-containing protein [Bacteroidota bacterium]